MRYLLLFWVSCCLISLSGKAQDQSYFTINIGTFVNAQSADFSVLAPIGFVHAKQMDQNLYQIYLGGYEQRQAAEQAMAEVRSAGYTGAYVQEIFPTAGEPVIVVQLATLDARQEIDWERYLDQGSLYVTLNGTQIKIVAGTYPDVSNAREAIPVFQQRGFEDAFIRRVNRARLHKLGRFETGMEPAKQPLIPLEVVENPSGLEKGKSPASYGMDPTQEGRSPMNARGKEAEPATQTNTILENEEVKLPYIRPDVKRRSALDLQKVLKAEGAYTGSLDGLYGPGTQAAYMQVLEGHPQMRKYRYLGQQNWWKEPGDEGNVLQDAIDRLPESASFRSLLERYDDPIAKGYRAYWLFQSTGPSSQVNTLMNQALSSAFTPVNLAGMPAFDPNATYSYQRLDQLIQHIYYLHAVPNTPYVAPCWLVDRHPDETAAAQAIFTQTGAILRPLVRECDGFSKWQPVKILLAIAADIHGEARIDPVKWGQASAARSQLYVTREPLSNDMSKVVSSWNERLWQNLDRWATQDPFHSQVVTALKLSYFQTQVLLEDYFMDQGFKPAEAKTLALATMRTLVGYQLERFTR